MDKLTIDLIPREVVQRRAVQTRGLGWALAFIAALGVVALMAASTFLAIRDAQAGVGPLRVQVEAMRGVVAKLEPLTQQLIGIAARQEIVQELLFEPPWSAALHEIAAASNAFVWVDGISAEYTGAAGAPPTLVVTGTAASDEDLVTFTNNLQRGSHLSGISLQRGESYLDGREEPVIDFILRALIVDAGADDEA